MARDAANAPLSMTGITCPRKLIRPQTYSETCGICVTWPIRMTSWTCLMSTPYSSLASRKLTDLRDAVVRGERSRILEMNGWIKRSLRHGRHFSLWGSAVINPTRTDDQPRQNNGRMQTCRRTRQVYDLTCRYDSRWDPMLPEKTAASMHRGPWGCRAAFRHFTDIHVFLEGIGKPASRLENKVSLFQFHSRRVDTLCRLREHRGRECKTASRRKAATDMSRRAQNNGCPIHQPIRQINL